MKLVLSMMMIALLSSCSPSSEYAKFVRDNGSSERDGWDWIVIGASGGGSQAQEVIELLKRDAWRIEWFASATVFRERDAKAKGRLTGMRSIMLFGDAVGAISALDVAPRDLVFVSPTGEPPILHERSRPWRLVLVLNADEQTTRTEMWLKWAKEKKAGVVKSAKGGIESEQDWVRVLAEMRVSATREKAQELHP